MSARAVRSAATPVALAVVLVCLAFASRFGGDTGPQPRRLEPPPLVDRSEERMALADIRLPPPPAASPSVAPAGSRPAGSQPTAHAAPMPVSRILGASAARRPAAALQSPRPTAATIEVSASDRRAGEAVLRAAEAGKGPGLTLFWPASEAARRQISAYLARCAGLSVALLAEGKLWRLDDPPGQAWRPDQQAMSSIVRRADGIAPGLAQRIRSRHDVGGGVLVAGAARRFDALMFGALIRLAPQAAGPWPDIRAAYAIETGRLILRDLLIDGIAVPGTVTLGRLDRCG